MSFTRFWGDFSALCFSYSGTLSATVRHFEDGDRVCFLGDSITKGGSYHQLLELFYALRFPESAIDFTGTANVAPLSLETSNETLQVPPPNRSSQTPASFRVAGQTSHWSPRGRRR